MPPHHVHNNEARAGAGAHLLALPRPTPCVPEWRNSTGYNPSLCAAGNLDYSAWTAQCNSIGIGPHDAYNDWDSWVHNAHFAVDSGAVAVAGPHAWIDVDFLFAGCTEARPCPTEEGQQTPAALRAQLSLYAILSAPLIVGADLRTLDNETLRILKNKDVIAVNQDPIAVSGTRIRNNRRLSVWRKLLHDGSVAVVLLNERLATTAASTPVEICVSWPELMLLPSTIATVQNLWEEGTGGSRTRSSVAVTDGRFCAGVQPRGAGMYKISPKHGYKLLS